MDGHAARPGFANRIQHLNDIKPLLTESKYKRAMEQLLTDEIDVNTGVVGYRKGKGNTYLRDWDGRIERGRSIVLVDEMTAVALRHKYEHFLADEKWNYPADEYFRKTNLRDAAVIHYFADGERLPSGDIVPGRAGRTWAASKWFDYFHNVRSEYDIQPWCRYDRLLGRTLTDKMTGAVRKMVLSIEFGQRLRGKGA